MKAFLCFFSVAMAGISFSTIAAECPSGSEGHLCRAENGDAHAMFKVARAAYMEGRETGDLSKAYKWAWDSKQLGDRWGRNLLKMIYINANLHHDPVEAHRWLARGLSEGKRKEEGEEDSSPPDSAQKVVILWIRRLEATMTKEQIEEANSQTLE